MSAALKRQTEHPGILALRAVLKRLRSDDQGGYTSRYKGKWQFISTSLPQTSAKELDALFDLAGIEPDEIVALGDCKDCMYADHRGNSRGWAPPCVSCKHPVMSNFVAVASLTRNQLALSKDPARCRVQARLLTNARDGVWWATGIVTGEQFGVEWNATMATAKMEKERLIKRGMLSDSPLNGYRMTLKGKRALRTR